MLKHYQGMVDEFQRAAWEEAIAKGGKFVEAALKCLIAHLPGRVTAKGKDFKVDKVIRELENVPTTDAEDTVRVTTPRSCRFVYEISSNRGARHDPDEIDANQMDCGVVVAELQLDPRRNAGGTHKRAL